MCFLDKDAKLSKDHDNNYITTLIKKVAVQGPGTKKERKKEKKKKK